MALGGRRFIVVKTDARSDQSCRQTQSVCFPPLARLSEHLIQDQQPTKDESCMTTFVFCCLSVHTDLKR